MKYDLEKLRDLQASVGYIDAAGLAGALMIEQGSARMRLSRMAQSGTLERLRHGRYVLPPPPAEALVGVPVPAGIAAAALDRALAALLDVGRALSHMHDTATYPAAREWIEGAMREQSKQGAILRLMMNHKEVAR
jgi:predicted transcriptional regulator of viral defense system